VEAHLVDSADCNMAGAFGVSRGLRRNNFEIVHIQYPTVGFRYTLGPQLLSLFENCVVTIHEASQRHILRKLALLPFAVRSSHVIFTSEPERQFAAKWAPWTTSISSVIPVGSNIAAALNTTPRNVSEILYFGLIVPRKEFDEILELARLIQAAGLPLSVRIVGHVSPQFSFYFDDLRSKATGLPIIWDCNLSGEQIAAKLACASIAYLPYMDGASERRTTLKAALLNGVAVITTRGAHTPADLAEVVRFCQAPKDALAEILSLLHRPQDRSKLSEIGSQYGRRYDWERIARLHLQVYDLILSKRPTCKTVESQKKEVLG
jgi:glycosyltransferase involved in cell wall biosynthesis